QAAVYQLLRASDLCYVGSLHDGMNLVAKEFVAARDDERGVLVLSAFAGAARELATALIVDPRATDEAARALWQGLSMSPGEQAARMRAMRSLVARANIYRWAGTMLNDARRVRAAGRARHRDVSAATVRGGARLPSGLNPSRTFGEDGLATKTSGLPSV